MPPVQNARRRVNGGRAVTAVQVRRNLSPEIQDYGKRVVAHIKKMRGYEARAHEKAGVELIKAENHRIAVAQLIAEAKKKCDIGGFEAFQKKYCSDLGRSRIYEVIQIGSGEKTLEQSRAETRKRVAKHRSKESVTVTNSSAVETLPNAPEVPAAPVEKEPVEVAPPAPIEMVIDAEPEVAPVSAVTIPTPETESEEVDFLLAGTPEHIGTFLEKLGVERFFAALQFAPAIKASIEQRHDVERDDIQTLIGECRAHLHNPKPANIELAFKKLAQIKGICTKQNGTKAPPADGTETPPEDKMLVLARDAIHAMDSAPNGKAADSSATEEKPDPATVAPATGSQDSSLAGGNGEAPAAGRPDYSIPEDGSVPYFLDRRGAA